MSELSQEKAQHAAKEKVWKAKEKDWKGKVKKKEEELENLRTLLRREQDAGTAQQRMLQQYEAQQLLYTEEKAEFLRAQRKLTELKHMETLVTGESSSCSHPVSSFQPTLKVQKYFIDASINIIKFKWGFMKFKREFMKFKREFMKFKQEFSFSSHAEKAY